ncbi:MAG: proline hydroxylase [Hyphomicrobiales bacterium]|nr:MAG: proline hydroxylase [Hyphomicrobiales bacterium]
MMPAFTQDWIDWIDENVNSGMNKDGIFKILLENGYEHEQIKTQMKHEPAQKIPSQSVGKFHIGKKVVDEKLLPPVISIEGGTRLDTDKAEFYLIENFLNEEECATIIEKIQDHLRPSLMVDHDTKKSSFRTSRTCDMGALNDPFINMIDERICQTIGIDAAFSEAIQGQFYEVGQEFKAHTDFFEKNELPDHDNGYGQRSFTFFIYLNEVEEGGHTDFPMLGVTGVPKIGDALIWNSLNADGSCNYNTLHHGMPVRKGWKAVITKWFRLKSPTKSFDQRLTKTDNEKIKPITDIGFKVEKLDELLHEKILNHYEINEVYKKDETVEGDFITNDEDKAKQAPSTLTNLSARLKKEIHDYLKPKLEEWSGVELEPTFVYGIRTYNEGAKLRAHRDRLDTHIISCIINIYQDVDEDWPLQIDDHHYRTHDIVMQPGDMVFYEGARLQHGREIPLKGRAFANIFCHFKPVNA